MSIDTNNIVTTLEIPNHSITKSLGIVRGISVRSRSLFGNIGAGFQTLWGGNISIYTKLCEKTRQEAFEVMVAHAQELGANAIVGFRYDANEVSAGVTEVLAYDTAVIIEKK